jgi:peroxiredoxin
MNMSKLLPRKPVPALTLPLAPEGEWTLNAKPPQHFTLLVFYRGLHCPVCRKTLQDLNNMLERFDKAGVQVIAISCDDAERAINTQASWSIANLQLGYGLSIEEARRWGLYISAGLPDSKEPAAFSEPGVFLVRPDGTLFMAALNSMPFARPHFDEILDAVDFVLAKAYPARGEA